MLEMGAHRWAIRVASWLLLATIAWLVWPVNLGGCTSLIIVNGESMLPTLHPGDLAVARCGAPKVGDVIIYRPFEGNPVTIIHRLDGGDGKTGWTARGDNNTFDDPFNFTDKNVVGVMVASIPKAGFFLSFLTSPLLWLTLALAAIGVFLWPVPEDNNNERVEANDAEEDESDPADSPAHQTT